MPALERQQNVLNLSDRENGRFRGSGWHQFGRSQNIDLRLLPKILVPDIADRASYRLYGLTADEIKVVEGERG